MKNPISVTIPSDLIRHGVRIVICRRVGAGLLAEIEQRAQRRTLDGFSPEFIAEARRRREEEGADSMRTDPGSDGEPGAGADPADEALARWPMDLVCAASVRVADGVRLARPAAEEWAEEVHPDVARHVAVAALRASGLIRETEAERGNGSGASADS